MWNVICVVFPSQIFVLFLPSLIIEINGGKNKWYAKNELVRHLEGATMRRQNYTDLKTRGMAAPVHGIGISIPYIQEHLSKFGEYCSVPLLGKCALTMAHLTLRSRPNTMECFIKCWKGRTSKFSSEPAKVRL
ncbi:hypothetical protein BC830DRAFT_553097 [Chytriomyces sp. MP71]|nr:hypothetical protein BC830DRAFT_553097 [Chytriomyces sp. MP71]